MMSSFSFFVLFFALIAGTANGQVPPGRVWERVDAKDDVVFNGISALDGVVFAVGDGGSVWVGGSDENWDLERTYSKANLHGVAASKHAMVAVGEGG